MLGSMPAKGNVQASARAAVANVSEYGRAFEGGSGRDIRMEGFVRVGPGSPGSSPVERTIPTPPRRAMLPLVLIVVVLLLAS
jgi:hypothetical protein